MGAGSNPPYKGSAFRLDRPVADVAGSNVNDGQAGPRRCAGCGEPTDERPPASLGCCRFCGRPTCSWACATLHEAACLLRTDSTSEFTDDDDTFVRNARRASSPMVRRPRPKFCASFHSANAKCNVNCCDNGTVANGGCGHAELRADKESIRENAMPRPCAGRSTLLDQG